MKQKLIEVKNLKVYFKVKETIFSRIKDVHAVDDVSFTIYKGEKVGLVGESGCGKTTLGRSLMGLVRITDGKIYYEGNDVSQLIKKRRLNYLYKKAQFIFQDPYSSLNPRFKIYTILERPLVNFYKMRRDERREKIVKATISVGLDEESLDKFPHEFSGGQRQRIIIARALISNPLFLIADEPTSSLDVSVQAKILKLLSDTISRMDLSLLFISHNLAVVNQFCDKILVMYLGKIVEIASWSELFKNPLHYYTKALINAVPLKDPSVRKIMKVKLDGPLPSIIDPPKGCRLNTRCSLATDFCSEKEPPLIEVKKDHFVACHLYK